MGGQVTWPEDLPPGVEPSPWTKEEIDAYNERTGAFQPGGAVALEKAKRERKDRMKALKKKGVAALTPSERNEILTLLLEDT